MKKTIFLVCCFSVTALVTTAQQFAIGARAGYSRSELHISASEGYSPNNNFKPINGFHAGFDALIMLGERLGMQTGLLYSKKGYTGRLDWPTGPADAYWSLHYLNLPVLLDYRVFKGLSLQGGAELGRLLSTRVKSGSENFEVDGLYEEFDFGLVAGLEYRLKNGFFIGARQIFGLYKIQEFEVTDDTGSFSGEASSHNRSTQFSAGYRYSFGQ